jgi:hypothetical protein
MRAIRSLDAAALALVLAGLTGCKFSPRLSSGSLACGPAGSCPPGLSCAPNGVCCAPGDTAGACADGGGRTEGQVADAAGPGGGAPAVTARGPDGSAAPENAPPGDASAAGGPTPGSWPRLVEGNIRVLAPARGCSSGPAGVDDRWCGFFRGNELWVLNVTRAAATGSARCDGTDPGCLRLSQTAFRPDASPLFPAHSLFTGDVLVYHTDARQEPNTPFRGSIHAWRPGWSQGRRLTSANGASCEVNFLDGSTAVCVDNHDGDRIDLLGGRLPLDGQPLPLLERAVWQFSGSQVTFSGDYIVYSWAREDGQHHDLYAVAAGQVQTPGSRTLLAPGGFMLAVADNGTKAFFTRIDEATGTSTVLRVDVPSGRNVVEMIRGIDVGINLQVPGGREMGLLIAQNLDKAFDADLTLFPAPAVPSFSVPIGRSWLGSFFPSPDGRYLLFMVPEGPLLEARVYDVVSRRSCSLGPTGRADPVAVPFGVDGRTVLWDKNTGYRSGRQILVASSADCSPIREISPRALAAMPTDHGGAVVRDDTGDEEAGPLRYLAERPATAEPQVIDLQANKLFMLSPAGARTLVLFTSSAPGREGLYLAKVPF